jgi:hypothetical protein
VKQDVLHEIVNRWKLDSFETLIVSETYDLTINKILELLESHKERCNNWDYYNKVLDHTNQIKELILTKTC